MIREDVRVKVGACKKISNYVLLYYSMGSFIFSFDINVKCCADSTPGLKSIIVNKRKSNKKHTKRTKEFTWFGKLPTSTETTEKFHYKNREIQ